MLPKLEQDYLDKFGEYFPLLYMKAKSDEEIDALIAECLKTGKKYEIPKVEKGVYI